MSIRIYFYIAGNGLPCESFSSKSVLKTGEICDNCIMSTTDKPLTFEGATFPPVQDASADVRAWQAIKSKAGLKGTLTRGALPSRKR